MRALQYDSIGAPEDVLALHEVEAPHPGPGQVRVIVHACGVNPADWALCEGLFPGVAPPRGVGLEVAGTVDEIGAGVTGVAVGDALLGPVPFDAPTAGAADAAVLSEWTPVPDGLDLRHAASLPMAGETAWRGLDLLGVDAGQVVLVHGAGAVVGEVAVQMALLRGARVIATAGPTRAAALEELGARVTSYGPGMVERVGELAGGPVDRALDASPVGGSLPDLVRMTGDPAHVLTWSDHAAAEELGVRVGLGEPRNDVLGEVARLAATGQLTVPVARTFALEEFRDAAAVSRSKRVGGKLLFLP